MNRTTRVIAIIIALLFVTLTIENGYKTDGIAQKTKEGTVIKAREQQPYTTSVQNIVDDFRGRGTFTEFVFVFLRISGEYPRICPAFCTYYLHLTLRHMQA